MIQAWVILINKARSRQTITYGELSQLMFGKPEPRNSLMRLGHLYTYCEEHGLPILPVIVVTKKTGLPADMAPYYPNKPDGPEPNAERAKVFNYDWFAIHPPCERDLHD